MQVVLRNAKLETHTRKISECASTPSEFVISIYIPRLHVFRERASQPAAKIEAIKQSTPQTTSPQVFFVGIGVYICKCCFGRMASFSSPPRRAADPRGVLNVHRPHIGQRY